MDVAKGVNSQDGGVAALPMLMSTREAAKILGLSERGLTRLACRGKIPGAFKVGALWRFNRAKLEAYCGIEA